MTIPAVERGSYRRGTGGIPVRKKGAPVPPAVPPTVPGAVQQQFRSRCSGTTAAAAVLPPDKKLQNNRYEKKHNLIIRTPFSMILGSLESQRRVLQDHAEKHHCPSFEEEIIRREFDLSKKDTPGKPPFRKPENRFFCN